MTPVNAAQAPLSHDSPASPATQLPWSERFYFLLRPYLTPGLRNSQADYAEELRSQSARAVAWLDLGCGQRVVPAWVEFDTRDLVATVGLDPDVDALRQNVSVRWRVAGHGEILPFADRSFDLVTANMVLEHLADPTKLFREVSRILRPGGRFLVHTPNLQGYSTVLTRLVPSDWRARLAGILQRRQSADVFPTYYRANAPDELQRLGAAGGFTSCHVRHVHSSPQFLRIPPLLVAEMLAIRTLSRPALARFRACLIADFERAR